MYKLVTLLECVVLILFIVSVASYCQMPLFESCQHVVTKVELSEHMTSQCRKASHRSIVCARARPKDHKRRVNQKLLEEARRLFMKYLL